jgi:hypothetical protein
MLLTQREAYPYTTSPLLAHLVSSRPPPRSRSGPPPPANHRERSLSCNAVQLHAVMYLCCSPPRLCAPLPCPLPSHPASAVCPTQLPPPQQQLTTPLPCLPSATLFNSPLFSSPRMRPTHTRAHSCSLHSCLPPEGHRSLNSPLISSPTTSRPTQNGGALSRVLLALFPLNSSPGEKFVLYNNRRSGTSKHDTDRI